MRFTKNNDALGTINRGNPTESSLCTLCRADCQGKCETWLSSMVDRKLLYPKDFGWITAGMSILFNYVPYLNFSIMSPFLVHIIHFPLFYFMQSSCKEAHNHSK